VRLPSKTRSGPRLVAGASGFAHSTVWKVLHRHGLSRRPRSPRSRPTATSGPVRAISCTWMSAATSASSGPATASPATARSARKGRLRSEMRVGYDRASPESRSPSPEVERWRAD
jgi:hypothetical protein